MWLVVSVCLWVAVEECWAMGARGRSCVGGHRDGSRVDFPGFWFHCSDGVLEPRGCFAQNRKRMALDETYVHQGLEVLCHWDAAIGDLALSFTACVVGEEGAEERVRPGDAWMGPAKEWYECQRNETAATIAKTLKGCVLESGQSVLLGWELLVEDVIYKCTEDLERPVVLNAEGCMHDGQRHGLGETFQDGEYWYSCTLLRDDSARKARMGCVHYGQRVGAGDRYVVNDVIHQCDVETPSHRVVGCVRRRGQGPEYQALGGEWLEGASPYKYRVRCEVPEHFPDLAIARPVGCVYQWDSEDGQDHRDYLIQPGCFVTLSKRNVACVKEEAGQLSLEKFGGRDLYQAYRLNVRFCPAKFVLPEQQGKRTSRPAKTLNQLQA